MNANKHFVEWLKAYPDRERFNEAERLKLLAASYNYRDKWKENLIKERRLWHQADKLFGEDGKVAVIWSGRDCDCVQYSNVVYKVKSDWRSIEEHIRDTYSWADGPCSYYLEKPSVADELHFEARDLALEAFEDGHPYHIHV